MGSSFKPQIQFSGILLEKKHWTQIFDHNFLKTFYGIPFTLYSLMHYINTSENKSCHFPLINAQLLGIHRIPQA